jgi:hypothetical protein
MKDDALSDSKPDEYLYGRSGYLYTLMFLRREIGNDIIDKQLVIDVKKNFAKKKNKSRFLKSFVDMYRFSKRLLNPVKNMPMNQVQNLH